MKTLYWVVGIFLVCIGLLFIFSGNSGTITPALALDVLNPHDHVEGNASSTITVIEYADFQCPACRAYYPLVKQMAQEFGSQVAFVYRYFPLVSIHPNAEFGARAAEAAGLQGKFWEMHNLLYEKQDEWAEQADVMKYFDSYAQLIGINVAKFDVDFKSVDVKNIVEGYRNFAEKNGMNSTPTFYVNGKKIDNPQSVDAFRAVIQNAIKNPSLNTDATQNAVQNITGAKPVTYKDLIEVDTPLTGASVGSPLSVSGKARGNWYFEASFPVQILDADGTLLGSGPAQAQGEWTTTNYVPFTASITFKTPKGKTGSIVFKKDNPSGDPAKDDSISVPVVFK